MRSAMLHQVRLIKQASQGTFSTGHNCSWEQRMPHLHIQEHVMLCDVLLYLVCCTGCTARLCLCLEFGLEVLMDIILLCRHPGCDASAHHMTCKHNGHIKNSYDSAH